MGFAALYYGCAVTARSDSDDLSAVARESVGWVELFAIPIICFACGQADGYRFAPPILRLRHCFASFARRGGANGCDKTTRRANHQKAVQPTAQKYFAFAVGRIDGLTPRVSPDERGVSRSSRTRVEMRWTRKLRLTSVA